MTETAVYGNEYGQAQARDVPPTYLPLIDEWLPIGSTESVLEIGVGKGVLVEHLQRQTKKTSLWR